MSRRFATAAVATVGLVVGLLVGLGAGPGAAAADPSHQAPVVGLCFDLDADELAGASYTEAPVECADPHTSTTIAVIQLPEAMGYDSRGLERFVLEACLPAQRRVLGTSTLGMRMSAYEVGYFVPTPEQQGAGARWVRCDLVLGGPTAPQQLPTRLELGRLPYPKAVARCLAGRDFRLTVCSQRHTYRASATTKVGGTRLPTDRAWERIGNRRCRGAVGSRVFRFGWPSKASWQAGDRTLICYTKTRH